MSNQLAYAEESPEMIEKAFKQCNVPGCGYMFTMRGCSVNVKDMREHKAKHSPDEIKALFKQND